VPECPFPRTNVPKTDRNERKIDVARPGDGTRGWPYNASAAAWIATAPEAEVGQAEPFPVIDIVKERREPQLLIAWCCLTHPAPAQWARQSGSVSATSFARAGSLWPSTLGGYHSGSRRELQGYTPTMNGHGKSELYLALHRMTLSFTAPHPFVRRTMKVTMMLAKEAEALAYAEPLVLKP
jgi:hypothetical protein